ncbi:MAG TPA: DUF3300 domain-containing protein [Nitrospirales bacterium]|nr:DUF3300 domain-containing protein [Nitrospirales bacterium]
MKARAQYVLTQVLVLLLSVSVAFPQQIMPTSEQDAPAQSRPTFTQQELDQMLAPIALYPDSLLTQILMASTYPLEIVEATRWSRVNPNLKGDQAVQAVAQNSWDPSVKSLVAFPQILQMMDEKLDWTERLGDAFLAQQAQVMDTVQNLRQKAYAAGNLQSTDQARVTQQGQTIVVEPTNPQVVYVPYYDPLVVYGPWWWPAYPPVYWAPWPGYFVGPGFGVGFVWGVGITVGAGFFFGAFDWPHRHVNVITVNNFFIRNNVVRTWGHDPIHRRGVLYRDASLRQQFRRTSASPEVRRDFRGHEPSSFEGRREFGNRPEARGGPGSRPEERVSPGGAGARPNMGSPPSRLNRPDVSRSDTRSAPSRPSVPSGVSRPHVEPQPHAFEGVGHGADVRTFSARGHASFQGSAPRASGGFHGGGGSSRH